MKATHPLHPCALALAAVAALGASANAHAQSSVTLYGIIDAAVLYTNNAGGHSLTQAGSGSVTGSHWGFLGREDLGGGTRAVFQLENGFSVMNGSIRQGGREFGYQAYTGLENNRYGAVTLGRQYDSVVDFLAPLSFTGHHPGGNNLSAHPFDNDNLNNSFRVNNAVKYTSVVMQGLQVGALYGFSNSTGGADNRVYSFGAHYAQGPITIAAAYLQASRPGDPANTNGAITSTDETFVAGRQRIFGAGVAYALSTQASVGVVWTRTQLGGLNTINGANSLGITMNGTGASFNNVELNATYRFTPSFSLSGEYTYTTASISTATGAHRPKWHEASVVGDYALSKRTDVYLQASYQHLSADGSRLTADISGQALSTTNQQVVVGAGMRHRF